MNSALFLQVATVVSDLVIFVFVGFYFWSLSKDRKNLDKREKQLQEKQQQIENQYNQIIDIANQQKRKILEDTASKSSAIIANTQFITESSKQLIERSLQEVIASIQQKALTTSEAYIESYKDYLDQTSQKTLGQFQGVASSFENEMRKQTTDLKNTLLSSFESELKKHQQQKLAEAEQKINEVVKNVSQKVLNKSISYEDHKNLIIEALEKAQKEGVFG
ncbi:hypothetical protein JXA63_00270 [Candidatus Woesebacteria bacterium]|nr:hypothetical protein [Candidatus Woesebacteria bacterium]